MNGLAREFSMTKVPAGVRKALAGVALCALCGCGSLPDPVPLTPSPIASDSPIAREVAAAAAQPQPFPTWADIPKKPADVRDAEGWRLSVNDIRATGATTEAEGRSAFTLTQGTDDFANDARRDATPPPAVTTPSETDTFLREMRARATPPPRPR